MLNVIEHLDNLPWEHLSLCTGAYREFSPRAREASKTLGKHFFLSLQSPLPSMTEMKTEKCVLCIILTEFVKLLNCHILLVLSVTSLWADSGVGYNPALPPSLSVRYCIRTYFCLGFLGRGHRGKSKDKHEVRFISSTRSFIEAKIM